MCSSDLDFGAGYKPQQITFIYVKDLIECIFRVIEKGFIRKEYNVSEERAYTSSEFRLYAQKKLGKKVVVPVTVPLFVLKAVSFISEKIGNMQGKASTLNMDKYRIMKQRNWKCDISEIQKDLDFTPEYSLEKGVSEIIEWYKKEGWI